jgi:hypothetical protein
LQGRRFVLVAGDGRVETLLVVLDFGVDLLLAEELGVEDGAGVGQRLREDVEGGTAAGELRLEVAVGRLLLGQLDVQRPDLVDLVLPLVGRLGEGVLRQRQVGPQTDQVLL